MSNGQPTHPLILPGSEQNRGPAYRSFLIALITLVTITIVLRFWSRSLGSRQLSGIYSASRFWWDDWLALIAVALLWTFFGVALALLHLGVGRHIWTVGPANRAQLFKLLYAASFLFDVSLFLSKTSALLFLSRIFPRHANAQWWNCLLGVTYGLNVAWLLGVTLGLVFMCQPIKKGWDPMVPGKCGGNSALWIGSAITSVAIDFVILLLPVPKIWPLHISRARKSGILFMFVLIYSVIVVSLGRLVTAIKSAKLPSEDVTYESLPHFYWVTCEAPVTLISICLPPMINLVKKIHTSFLSPISSKVSSTWRMYAMDKSTLKSRDGVSALEGGEAGFGQNHAGVATRDESVHSEESRSELVNKPRTSVTRDSYEISLSDMTTYEDRYHGGLHGKQQTWSP